ncbi:MAG: heavy metal translocating P-type ATPase [Clostridia bacterium]|nr:heavy metal translocating P-type ATPase [Clostridia bacterium]
MKRRKIQIAAGGALLLIAVLVNIKYEWSRLALFIVAYLIVGWDVVLRAAKNVLKGRVFDENFLMSVATIGTFFIAQYAEGVAVMLFYQVGELFQLFAVAKSRKSIAGLMDIRPDYANVEKAGELIRTKPEEVRPGDIIVIKPGERIPLDAVVVDGNSFLDTSALTGEALPREVAPDSELLSGCINLSGVLTARVTKEYGQSTVSKILDLVENAAAKKSQSERFITKFARYYTPAVVIIAAALAVAPPLIFQQGFDIWVYRALSFLVVSCPCALVISIPLSFFGGIGGASRRGILIKGGNYLEALAKTEIMVFDKTGTLTKGVFEVQKIFAVGMPESAVLELAAYAESFSGHPISLSLKEAYGRQLTGGRVTRAEDIAGYGVSAIVDGREVFAGSAALMQKLNVPYTEGDSVGTVVHVAVDKKYAGHIVISDELKSDAAQAVKELKSSIKHTVMLTGDNEYAAKKVAEELGIEKVYSGLLPGDKVRKMEELFALKSAKGKIAFAGDGINDAPVLARADIGIAMGALGSDAAIEAADVVIMTDEPSKIPEAIRISKKTLRIAYQNIILAIGIKTAVLVLSALGITTMWAAIFADVGVTIIAVLNAFRALIIKKGIQKNVSVRSAV